MPKTRLTLKKVRKRLTSWLATRGYFEITLWSIVALTTILHFYLLVQHLHYDIDEATHTKTIWEMFANHHLLSKGPPASGTVDLYHGAFYYYLYLIPTVLFYGSPLGPALFTVILSVTSVWLLAKAAETMYGRGIALTAAFLYGVSYYAIIYSRWIWNPNTIPFFTALSLFALSRAIKGSDGKKGNPWYLVLFSFAVGAISQLHVGELLYVPIFVLLIPWIPRITKNHKIWAWSITAFLLPWVPTIIHELRHNFELIRGLIAMLQSPAHIPLIAHAEKGYDYFSLMFRFILQVPEVLFWVMFTTGAAALLIQLQKTRPKSEMVFPLYIILTLLISYLTYAFYPGILFLHLSEQLFVIFPLLAAFFFQVLYTRREALLAALILFIFIVNNNMVIYTRDIVHGTREYPTIQRICRTIKDARANNVEIVVNKKFNPIYATYLCEREYGINAGSTTRFVFTTNFKDTFEYSVESTDQPYLIEQSL